jgi:hypothetical protein
MSRWTTRAAYFGAAVAAVAIVAPATAATASAASPSVMLPLQLAAAAGDQFAGLRQRLAITPAQEAKFAAFVAVIQRNDQARSAFLRQNPPDRRRNALEEFRVRAAAADLDARGQRQLLSAFQSLYNSLSPTQRRTANAVFAAPPATHR